MKQIRILLLLVVACLATCAFAQQTTPDYVKKAQADLTKYYPQFKDYFEPIFAEYKGLGNDAMNIFNSKIHENFDIFEEDLTTERDKCATILTALDECLGDKTFMKSKKQVDSPDGEDLINTIAGEITADIKVQFVKELNEAKERLAKADERLARANEKIARANEIIAREKERNARANEKIAREKERNARLEESIARTARIQENIKANKSPQEILLSIEDLFEVSEIKKVKDDLGTQGIIKYYISIGKKINHKPSAIGQKFIDEYNRINPK